MPILTPEERVGTELAERYRIEKILGKGGMGVVYQGRHLWTEREVALKILFHQYAEDEGIARRFLHEARAAATIKHPNVVDVLDMGQDEDTVYLVLEMLEGQSFADYLDRHAPLEAEDALEKLLPVMDALAAAHRDGIVHRDLKPDNIFLSISGKGKQVSKLLDFGIAKVKTKDGTPTTQTGAVIGTPQYMAPEQVRGDSDVTGSADVWSMGVVLFEALTGRLPFEDEQPTAILAAILTRKPPSISEMGVDIPAPIAMTIDRALVEDRSIRFKTMREFAKALVEAAEEVGLDFDRVTMLPRISDDEPGGDSDERTTLVSGKRPTPGPATRALRTPRPSSEPLEFPETTEPWSERPTAMSTPEPSAGPSRSLVMGVLGVGVLLAGLGGVALVMQADPVVEPAPVDTQPLVEARVAEAEAEAEARAVAAELAAAEAEAEAEAAEVEAQGEAEAEADTEAETMAQLTAAQQEARRRRREERRRRREAEAAAMDQMDTSMEAMTMRGANDALIIR